MEGPKPKEPWDPFSFFIGRWEGSGAGESGQSKVEREYQFVLGGKYLRERNKSSYAPQERNPKGEQHEDWGFVSYDSNRKQFVFRQFHSEGFVNQYVMEGTDGKSFTFVSEGIENISAGWRARTRYQVLGADEFRETFELAPPGKEFQLYVENRLKRVKW